jgi:RimJ/RimL family protein N-acetyltransferase
VVHLIASGRVFLRPFERSDAQAYHRWRNDPDLVRFASLGPPVSLVAVERRIEQLATEHGNQTFAFVICLTDSERAIGEISLFDVDRRHGSAELGVFIGEPDELGKGYGTDAVNALVDFGFGELRLERIHLEVWTENPRAIRSYQKAGFVHEGTARNDRFEDGQFTSGHLMSILRHEWLALPRRAMSHPNAP